MLQRSRIQLRRGQTRQEIILVIVVVAVALIAMLSVFIPALRAFWVSLGRAIFG